MREMKHRSTNGKAAVYADTNVPHGRHSTWQGRRVGVASSSTRLILPVLFAILLLLTAVAGAQIGGSGSISGSVTDSTGAAVPGASVTATNAATNVTVTQATSGSGTYVLSPLTPGEYEITISAKGFKNFAQEHVVVDALAQVTVKSVLTVGGAEETVTVTTAPPQLDTTSAATGITIESEDYTELPLQMNGSVRNPTGFVYLTPGVAHGGVAVQTGIFNGTGSVGRVDEVYIDGFPQTSIYEQGDPRYVSNAISVEAVDQFQVVTGGQSAQYQGIGLENYVIKSGGNNIHGSVFEYMRTTALDTWGFYAPAAVNPTTGTAVKPNEHQSEYGVDLSGPIRKNKLFYFGNYDGFYYHKDSNPSYATYPTLKMRTGDFSELLAPGTNCTTTPSATGCIFDPTSCPVGTTGAGTCTRTPFIYNGQQNVINPSRLGPAEAFLTKFLPPLSNSNTTNNFLGQVPTFSSHWSNTNRVDWKINDKQAFAGVFSVQRGAPYGYVNNGSNPGPLPYTSAQNYETKNKIFLLEHNYSVTPNLINQLKYSYTRFWGPVYNPQYRTPGYGLGTDGGVTGLPAGQASGSFPTVTFSGGSVAPTQWSNGQDYNSMTNYFTLLDNVQWVHNKHSLTFGFTKEWLELNEFQYNSGTSVVAMTYSNTQTAFYAPTGSGSQIATATGNAFASLFVGDVNQASFTQLPFDDTAARMRNLSLYTQDDYRLNSKLTINLGLRWDYFPPYEEAQDRSSWFSPSVANPLTGNNGALVFAGHGTAPYCNCNTPVVTWYKNFGPRIGAEYSIRPTTVLRAGFALTYSHGTGVRNATYLGTGLDGYAAAPTFVSNTAGDPAFMLDSGIPAYTKPPIINSTYGTYYTSLPHSSSVGMSYPDPYLGDRAPYVNNYAAGIEQQVTHDMTMSLNYVGSQAHFLPVASGGARGYQSNALNPFYWNLTSLLGQQYSGTTLAQAQAIDPGIAVPYASFSGTIQQMLVPYPQYGGISDTYDNISNSTYNSVQFTVRQRMSKGLQFMFNWAFSEEEDDNGTFRSGYLPNRVERSRGVIDEPQIGNATFVYNLPFGKGHLGGGSAFTRALTGGWLVSGIYSYNSGTPLPIVGGGCNAPGGSTCMPNYNPNFSGPVRINGSWGRGATAAISPSYINVNAFVDAIPAYTFGNVARTKPYGLRGPTSYDVDMSVKKNLVIHEHWNALFDVSAYNVTNVTVFNTPAVNTHTPSTFGTVSSQANNSRDIQLALRINW